MTKNKKPENVENNIEEVKQPKVKKETIKEKVQEKINISEVKENPIKCSEKGRVVKFTLILLLILSSFINLFLLKQNTILFDGFKQVAQENEKIFSENKNFYNENEKMKNQISELNIKSEKFEKIKNIVNSENGIFLQ